MKASRRSVGRNGDCDADGIGMNDSPEGESRYRYDDVLGEEHLVGLQVEC
jgi:hypothetical protein